MFGQRVSSIELCKLAIFVAVSGAMSAASAESRQGVGYQASDGVVTFSVDVAENFDLFETSLLRLTSAHSAPQPLFVTEGKVFPAGTIRGDGSDFHPDSERAIGRWVCRGARTSPTRLFPPMDDFKVQVAQIYLFPDETRAIATVGFDEEADATHTISHATGMYRGYIGEQRQEFLGYNATGGVNLRVTFVLTKPE